MTEKLVVRTKIRIKDIRVAEKGLLLHIAQEADSTGLYQRPDEVTAIEAGDEFSRVTVLRMVTKLIRAGYLDLITPGKAGGVQGAVSRGVRVSPKGYKMLQHTRLVNNESVVHGEPDRSSYEQEYIDNSKDSCDSNMLVESVIDSKGIAASELRPEANPEVARLTAENILLFREIAFHERSRDLEQWAEYAAEQWVRRTEESRILTPVTPVTEVYTLQQATRDFYESYQGEDAKQQAAEAKALAQVKKLGLGYLEQGEFIGGSGSYKICGQTGITSLNAQYEVRRPLCECGQRVDFILDTRPGRGVQFWSLGRCYIHRPRCSRCGRVAYADVVRCDKEGGYIETSELCFDCIQASQEQAQAREA